MSTDKLINELNLDGSPIGIKLIKEIDEKSKVAHIKGCMVKLLNNVSRGEEFILTLEHIGCPGAIRGCGFKDNIPNMPGGFGHFISYGKGKGYPKGERIKANPEIAMEMIENQPNNVFGGKEYISLKPYKDYMEVDTVGFIVNPDQLSALIHLYNFKDWRYDNIIAPMCSGCASIFRIPFYEMTRENPRAVIGNVDIFSRPHLDKNTFVFVVPHNRYLEMIKNIDDSFFYSHIWNGIKKRL